MSQPTKKNISALVLGAIGVVYGDIGTSPLYAMKETFAGHHPLAVVEGNILGVLSVMFWTIMVLVSVKYVAVIMRADNRGEGGSLALLALVSELTRESKRLRWVITLLGVFAAALFYGDSMITPAISVLSAVEGLNIVAPELGKFVMPISAVVLTGLFFIRSTVPAWSGWPSDRSWSRGSAYLPYWASSRSPTRRTYWPRSIRHTLSISSPPISKGPFSRSVRWCWR